MGLAHRNLRRQQNQLIDGSQRRGKGCVRRRNRSTEEQEEEEREEEEEEELEEEKRSL